MRGSNGLGEKGEVDRDNSWVVIEVRALVEVEAEADALGTMMRGRGECGISVKSWVPGQGRLD